MTALVDGVDVLLLDLDGTVYRGGAAIPGAVEAVRRCSDRGVRAVYVTNNASRRPGTIADQLTGYGLPTDAVDVVTSAQAGAALLASLVPSGTRTLVVGSAHLVEEVAAAGLAPVATTAGTEDVRAVGAVVQGFDPDVGWRDLAAAAYALAGEATWVATNADMSIPTADGTAPGNGSLVAAVVAAVGRRPAVAGKPQRPLIDQAVERTGARAALVVGDRLDTDIEGGNRAGLPTLLVLTGVSGPADLVTADPETRPTHLAADLSGLLEPASVARETDGGGWSCGGWTVTVGTGGYEVAGSGDRTAGLWALAHAAWAAGHADPGTVPAGLAVALQQLGWGDGSVAEGDAP